MWLTPITNIGASGDGAEITDSFNQYSQTIVGTGDLMDIEIEFSLDGDEVDIAIDNIEIWGTYVASTGTTTWDGTAWNPVIPDINTSAIIDGPYDTGFNGNIDANDLAGLIAITGHAITHFTVRDEKGIDALKPVVDEFAPLFHVRPDAPPILLLTGNRELELLGRYEENAYLMRMLRLSGHKEVEHLEFDGYGHGISIPAMPVLLRKVNQLTESIKSSSSY